MSKVYKKTNKNNKLVRTFAFTGTSLLTVFSLASCKSSSDIYSAINPSDTYSQIGDYKVSNYELFRELAWDGASQLDTDISNAIISSYYKEVVDAVENSETESYKEHHDEYVNKLRELFLVAMYGVDDMDSYFKINSIDTVEKEIQTGIDNLYSNYGIKITRADFLELSGLDETSTQSKLPCYIENKTLPELSWDKMSESEKSALKYYYSSLAQKLYALNYLNDSIEDYETDNNKNVDKSSKNYTYYYTDSKIISEWKTSYYYKYTNANGLMIRFNSEDEITETLKAFGVKLYNGKFYYIKQDGVIEDGETEPKKISDSEYDNYYTDFDFTDPSNVQNRSSLSDLQVLMLYIEMYNYIYPYRNPISNVDKVVSERNNNKTSSRRDITQAILNDSSDMSEEEFYTNYVATYSDYDKYIKHNGSEMEENISSTVRNMLYEDLDDYSYTTSGVSASDYYYMNYRFNVDTTELDKLGYTMYYKADANGDVTQKDSDGKDEKADSSVIDRTRSESIVSIILERLKDDELTSSYISTAINEAKKDAKISIYDENLSIAYAVGYSDYYSKTWGSAPSDNVVAKIEYDGNTTEINTDTLYKQLEATLGLTTAVDMLTKQIIKNTDEYKATESKIDEYYSQLNNVLTSFSNGGLSSYGYEASIGKYNFLMTYFHSSDVNTIINDTYRINDANTALLSNYASDSDLIDLFEKYATEAYNNTFTISATNLLVYVDFDEDGEPDKYFDWSKEVTITNYDGSSTKTTYKELACELIKNISNIMKNSSSTYADSLSSLVDEYKESSRFTNGYDQAKDESGNYDPTNAEKYWAKYKRAGLMIKSDDYSSVSNSTDAATIDTTLQNELMEIYKRNDFIMNETAPSEYLDTLPYTAGNGLESNSGYNLIVVTSATINASAKFEETSDVNHIYSNLYYYYNEKLTYVSNLYNDNDTLNKNQIIAYILEYADNSTSETIPSDISSALSSFFSPIYTKYTSSACQRELLINWCEAETKSSFSFTNTLNDDSTSFVYKDGTTETYEARFAEIRKINKRSADSYESTREFKHASVYDDFWGDLEKYVNKKYGK